MIVSKGTKPEYSLYYLGAQTLSALKQGDTEHGVGAYELFEKLKLRLHDYSFNQHLMTLSWLYILNTVNLNDQNKITLC